MTEQSFNEIFNRHYDKLYYYAVSLLKELGEREIEPKDVVQEVFLKLWAKKDSIQIGKESVYLYGETKYRCIDIMRKCNNDKRFDNEFAYYLTEQQDENLMIGAEVFVTLYERMKKLPKQCANVFVLYWNGYDTKEIAEKLNLSTQNVLNQKTIAINKLKTIII